MLARLRHFHANTGTGGVVRAVFMHLGFLGIPFALLAVDDTHQAYWTKLALAVTVAWLLPLLVSRPLVRNLDFTNDLIKGSNFVLLGLGAASGLLSRAVDTWHLIALFFPLGSAFTGLCWWFFSDRRITTER